MHQGVAVLMHVGLVLDVLVVEAEVSEALDLLPAALAEAAGQLEPAVGQLPDLACLGYVARADRGVGQFGGGLLQLALIEQGRFRARSSVRFPSSPPGPGATVGADPPSVAR